MIPFSMRRWACQAIVPLAFLGAIESATAQAPRNSPPPNNLLDETKKLQEVAAQKQELTIRLAMLDAQKLLKTDPAAALEKLQAAQQLLDSDRVLTQGKRDSLKKQVASLTRDARANVREGNVRATVNAIRADRQTEKQKQSERDAAEAVAVQQSLDRITIMQRAGRLDDAEREAASILKKFPENPAAQAMNRNASIASRVAEARALLAEQDKRVGLALRDVDRSALPPIGDIEYPKDWAEKTAKRKTGQLTAKEKAIMEALSKPVQMNLKDVPFEEVIQYLSDAMGQPLLVDKADLADANIDYYTPVSIKTPGKGVATRTALRQILNDLGLTYIVKDESIRVISQLKARDMMVTKVYPIADLVRGQGPFGGAVFWGPYIDELQTRDNAKAIIDLIMNSVDPTSWRGSGGTGSITYDPASMSLIVRNTAEVHMMMRGGLGR